MDDQAERLAAALDRWHCRVIGSELRGGMSVVVPVESTRGVPRMLKVLDPDAAAREAVALRAFPRAASVQCHEHVPDLGALLLERLTPRSLAGADSDEMITVQAQLARRLAVADPGSLQKLSDHEGWLDQLEHDRIRHPHLLTPRAGDAAREAIGDLAHDPVTTVTHGDLHSRNVHLDVDGRWRALDPDPRVGSIAFESHTVVVERDRLPDLVRSGPHELRRRLALFADVAEVDLTWATRLCQARAVSSALFERDRHPGLADGLRWMAEVLTD